MRPDAFAAVEPGQRTVEQGRATYLTTCEHKTRRGGESLITASLCSFLVRALQRYTLLMIFNVMTGPGKALRVRRAFQNLVTALIISRWPSSFNACCCCCCCYSHCH